MEAEGGRGHAPRQRLAGRRRRREVEAVQCELATVVLEAAAAALLRARGQHVRQRLERAPRDARALVGDLLHGRHRPRWRPPPAAA